LQIFISGWFFTVIDELLEFKETWGFAISFATCQPGNRYEYMPVEGCYAASSGAKG